MKFHLEKSSPNSIKIADKIVFYSDIINPYIFRKLYLVEKPLFQLELPLRLADRPFVNIPSAKMPNFLKKGEVLLIRISKQTKEAQFVSKIYEWGKISIPTKYVRLLKINPDESIILQIISKSNDLNPIKSNFIDLADISLKILPRAYSYITLYSKQKIPLTIYRFIPITPKLFELLYLVHGDGHYANKLYFANKQPELHTFVLLQFLLIFGIPLNLWKARILIKDLSFESFAKQFWTLNIPVSRFKFYSSSQSKFNTSNKGNLRIIIDNTIVANVFRYVFRKLIHTSWGDIYALNGLLYAEGGAQLNKKSLHKISLSFNKTEKKLFKGILDRLKLSYTTQQNRNFVIEGWENLYSFFQLFFHKLVIPFRIHPPRKYNAINGFINHGFTKSLKKYLLPLKNQNLTPRQLSDILKIRPDSILSFVRKSRYSNFIFLERSNLKRNTFILGITYEGKSFLRLIKHLEELN